MTYNMYWNELIGISALGNYVKRVQPDIIGFQELRPYEAEAIIQGVQVFGLVHSNIVLYPGGNGNDYLIVSRCPTIDSGSREISRKNRAVQMVQVDTGDQKYRVFNMHVYHEQNCNQMREFRVC